MDSDPVSPSTPQKPTIGRIVLYRSKRNPYDLPAVVTATQDSLWSEGVLRGDVKPLDSEYHVHLHVFTPGHLGVYQEMNIPCNNVVATKEFDAENPYGHGLDADGVSPGSWRWPTRV